MFPDFDAHRAERQRQRAALRASAGSHTRDASLVSDRLKRLGFKVASRFAPEHSLRVARERFRPSLARPVTHLEAAVSGHVGHDDDPIAFHRWGGVGQPLILLAHDWASDSSVFASWVRPLRAAGYAVVAFDQPGHGASGGTCMPWQFVDAMRVVSLHFGPFAAVVAHGHGALATTLLLAERVIAKKTVLLGPPADPTEQALRFARTLGLTKTLAVRFAQLDCAAAGSMEQRLVPSSRASTIGCPALVVHDIADETVSWSDGECYARHWPDARLLTTTGLSHEGMTASPAIVASALDFLHGEAVGERVIASPEMDSLLRRR